MIDVRCSCGAIYHAHEDFVGRSLQCNNPACRKILRIERPAIESHKEPSSLLQEVVREQEVREKTTVRVSQYEHMRRDKRIGIGIIAIGIITLFIWLLLRNPTPESAPPTTEATPQPNPEPAPTPVAASDSNVQPIIASPAEVKEREITGQDAAKPGDLELGMEYQEINERHFGNKLPAIPVLWEPRLREIGPLKAEGFTEYGLWTTSGEKTFILLNPQISRNAAATRRVLCHEMIHEYLFTKGDTKTHHGPAFQAELRRLLAEGAFQVILASEKEKESLRAWLDRESERLEKESVALRAESTELDSDQENIDAERDNVDQHNTQRVDAFNAKVDAFNGRIADFKANTQRHNADAQRFNLNARRYNLMNAYPDGLDEESTMPAKTPLDSQ